MQPVAGPMPAGDIHRCDPRPGTALRFVAQRGYQQMRLGNLNAAIDLAGRDQADRVQREGA